MQDNDIIELAKRHSDLLCCPGKFHPIYMAMKSHTLEQNKLYLDTMKELNHNVLPYLLEREYEILFKNIDSKGFDNEKFDDESFDQ